ncbi:MAG: DUF4178 domain-containing protein, partial [Planctomycetes bacterium]|nr:DUF4178 domain-containing protein [Planctomycetota bacterium]
MNTKELKCPNCGAEVSFSSPGTLVVVCAHCAYASRRTDVALESIGKLAMPAELVSHFQLGTRGIFEGEAFVVRGQLQLDHGAGPWNEWCVSTARGWLWLAEAQGRVSVLRPREVRKLPARERLAVGSEVELDASGAFVVSELGQGTLTSASGELPIALAPGAKTSYADLTRAAGGCATIDWTRATPEVFVGRFVELEELALDPATQPEVKLTRVAARRLACKNCGGPLELFEPRHARTVVCPSCNLLLDVQSEALVAAQTQEKLRATPRIRLGLATTLRGEDVRVLGFLRRAVRAEGVSYPWSEYLLRTARGEYRWLVENNGHWLLATPIEPGAVKARARSASYKGTTFRHFDGGQAEVLAVLGEFYWQVRLGDE